jgi:DNA-binding GntR family transcriptional regulator
MATNATDGKTAMRQTKMFRSKKEFVYEVLREEILTGELSPGTRLIIDVLSNDLGVSPIPIREALQQLQSDGLVIIEPYIGARVAELHPELIQEVFELLGAMEIISSRAACLRMSEDDFQEMEGLLRQMDEQLQDPETWSRLNVDLHLFISDRAGMSLVPELFRQVADHWNRLRRHYLDDVFAHRIQTAQAQHWHLLKALHSRNPDHVAQVIQEHNQSALNAYQQYLEQSAPVDSTLSSTL